MRVLLVEDDAAFAGVLDRALSLQGWTVRREPDAATAYRAVQRWSPDVLVIDWMLPDHDGPWLIRRIRELGVTAPVLLLTARDAVADRVRGLDGGADDYLVKPCHLDELTARLRALARRPPVEAARRPGLGPLVLDVDQQRAALDGRVLDLTRSETLLLETLLAHAPGAAPRRALARALEEAEGSGTDAGIDTHMSRLRAKVADPQIRVRTLRGLGYRLEASG